MYCIQERKNRQFFFENFEFSLEIPNLETQIKKKCSNVFEDHHTDFQKVPIEELF